MRYMIDTANINEIKHCIEYYPIEGVTTNPTLVAKEKTDFIELISGIRDIIGPDRFFLVQTRGETSEEIIHEAYLLRDFIGKNFVPKIPMCAEGLKATMSLSKEGFLCTITAICTHQQAMLAAKAGASFVAPYVNRLDNICANGVELVCDMAAAFDHYDIPCEVLAASFKNVQQIHECAMGGCHGVTIKAEMFDILASHPLTDLAIANFDNDWQAFYGDAKIADLLKK